MEIKRTPREDGLTWVVVLAAEGQQDSTGPTDLSGDPAVPAVYRSVDQALEDSPLDLSLQHAKELAPRERIWVVVAAEHRKWWRHPLWFLPASNVIAQPESEAIAHGVSRSMQKILERDREAKVVLLPAAKRASGSRAVVGTARAVLDLVKRNWPKAVDDVHTVAPSVAC